MRERRRRSAPIVVLAVALAAACAGGPAAGSGGAAGGARAHEPGAFTGSLDDFYRVPDPLPKGKAGDLIRIQPIGTTGGRTSVRVMYHSDDATGRDRAVTGVITYPTARPPKGGWPVVSTAHGTTGLASVCAPSRTAKEAPGWGVEGVWAMTDYVGLGPVGELHPYLSKPSEGNAVIDAVRAARRLDGAHAGRRWVAVGHSQGGHGALSAMELARTRAPELRLAGTVALAPGAMLDKVYGGIDPVVTGVLTIMGLVGGAGEHPDIDVRDYLTPQALAASEIVKTGCLDDITTALVPVVLSGAFKADPRETEPARSAILANDVGGTAVRGVPLYLASGTADDRVVIQRVRDLFARLCAAGQVTELQVVEGADHGSIVPATAGRVTSFLEGALAGRAPVDSCP
ncbi:MAG TPA: lipase family protein [Acidimicrobiales bacterium]|nr:lipase family protein [Acidimicrobiales bacterium]